MLGNSMNSCGNMQITAHPHVDFKLLTDVQRMLNDSEEKESESPIGSNAKFK